VTTVRPNHTQGSSIHVQRKAALPHTDLGWVELTDHFVATVGRHTGEGTQLGDLLVLADAVLAPKAQFALHAHEHMEIASIVLSGELVHREPDRALRIPAGSVQWMSAGDGIVHAETNPGDVPARLLQIWIRPEHTGGTARHHVAAIPALGPTFQGISPNTLRSGAHVAMARISRGRTSRLVVDAGRALYLFFADGGGAVNGHWCGAGDGAIALPGRVQIAAHEASTVVAIDIARGSAQSNF